jgi:hypothetical protein
MNSDSDLIPGSGSTPPIKFAPFLRSNCTGFLTGMRLVTCGCGWQCAYRRPEELAPVLISHLTIACRTWGDPALRLRGFWN